MEDNVGFYEFYLKLVFVQVRAEMSVYSVNWFLEEGVKDGLLLIGGNLAIKKELVNTIG